VLNWNDDKSGPKTVNGKKSFETLRLASVCVAPVYPERGRRASGVPPALFSPATPGKLELDPAERASSLQEVLAQCAKAHFLIDIWRLETTATYRKYKVATISNRHGMDSTR
jgi:hypothetical protein